MQHDAYELHELVNVNQWELAHRGYCSKVQMHKQFMNPIFPVLSARVPCWLRVLGVVFLYGFRLSLPHELTFGVELASMSVFLTWYQSQAHPVLDLRTVAPPCYVVQARCPVLSMSVRLPHWLRVRAVISLYKFKQSLPGELTGPEFSSIVHLLNIQKIHFNDRNYIKLLMFWSMCTNPSGFCW